MQLRGPVCSEGNLVAKFFMVRGVLMFAESRMSVLQGTQCLKGQETSLDTGVGVADVVLVPEVDFLEVKRR